MADTQHETSTRADLGLDAGLLWVVNLIVKILTEALIKINTIKKLIDTVNHNWKKHLSWYFWRWTDVGWFYELIHLWATKINLSQSILSCCISFWYCKSGESTSKYAPSD